MSDGSTYVVGAAGASGTVGRMVVERLVADQNITTIIRLSRRDVTPSLPVKLVWDAPTQHRTIDYSTATSLRAGFAGLDTLIFPGSDGDPEQMLAHHRNVVQAASDCKVGCFIYLSTLGASKDSRFPYAKVHGATEAMLVDASAHMRVHVLRASIFAEFFLDTFIHPALSAGIVHLPISSGTVSFVSRTDVARALAGAATGLANNTDDQRRLWNVTGPQAWSIEEVCSMFDVGTKRGLVFSEMSETSYREELGRKGNQPWLIDAFVTMLSSSIPANHFAIVSTDVEKLSGVRPHTIADVIEKTNAPGRMAKWET